ncbi:N-terminal double-transmembrane domain-containing protein [Dyadobacter koreensis]|uniref:N-terminal double-transmembrane domain-containing protein n=1 Tax=Dyadobacter koreensis TaxID=408657 RepID=A0A1H6Y1Q5_9BACT|nr:BatA domain-containing protein [Dyadobacter koreensis]SEJ31050.1 N-terminal double-transmembrane domain-containing protein [Dyadobacter koreensis]
MNFLQPFMFWGALAIAIPVFIHFWHQKKGKELDWAAMQWLIDKSQQQSRGFRLDDLPLLIVRCLLLLLLVFLMAQPVLEWFKKTDHSERIHLVEPSAYLADNYRFELEKAFEKGEKVYWINTPIEEIKDLSSVSGQQSSGIMYLQEVVNKINKPGAKLDIYLLNNQKIINQPKIYIPGNYTIHTAIDSSENYTHNYLDLGNGKKLFVNSAKLTASDSKSGNQPRLASTAIHSGTLSVLADYKNKAERETVQAALGALSTVYSLPFKIDEKTDNRKKYDIVLTDREIKKVSPETLYLLSGNSRNNVKTSLPNVAILEDSLRIQTSEIVTSGQLPEYLGDLLIDHFNLNEVNGTLSTQQLNAVFVHAKPLEGNVEGNLRPWLLVVFLILLILERWMALKKTIQKSYA